MTTMNSAGERIVLAYALVSLREQEERHDALCVALPSTPFGARVAQRLREEHLIWLTTVGADGTPQPNPVWFLWDGASVLVSLCWLLSQSDDNTARSMALHIPFLKGG